MPALFVDAGALFFAHPHLPVNRLAAAKVTARGIARAMATMGVQGIGVSPYDLAAGADFLQQLATENKLPLLSANLVQANPHPARRTNREDDRAPGFHGKDRQLLFAPYRIVNIGGTRVALIGLTGPLPAPTDSITLRPWQDVLPQILDEIHSKSDLIILLSSLPRQANQEIANKYTTIHILIQAGQQAGTLAPRNLNNTLLCQTGAKGKYLGILDIRWNASREWAKQAQQNPEALQRRLDRVLWQLQRVEKRHQQQELANNSYYKRLVEEKKRLEHTLAELKKTSTGQGVRLCTFKNTFLAMETSLPEDSTVRAIVDQTRKEVNLLNREQQKKQRLTNEIINRTFVQMAGEERCAECHPSQAAFYRRTDHARAWQTLTMRDQQYNPDCIACHATLPEYTETIRTNEALLTSLPARFYNVGCEACHGPSLAHANDPDAVLPSAPSAMTCKQCHTAQRDPQFNFREKKTKIECPAG